MKPGWVLMSPTGRWCTTMEAHGGHLALHAWVSGAWAVTRGGASDMRVAFKGIMVRGLDDDQREGADLLEAMDLAMEAAKKIADNERPRP